jgi:hypothetical protein
MEARRLQIRKAAPRKLDERPYPCLRPRRQLTLQPVLLFAREIPRSCRQTGIIAHPFRREIPEHAVDGADGGI